MYKKRLTNQSEKRTYDAIIRGLRDPYWHISKKVGVKDVIGATSQEIGNWPGGRKHIWWKGHFDFVCTADRSDEVEFVVEYDGPLHADPDVEARDRAKNALCRDAGVPILRIAHDNMLKEFEKVSVVEYMTHLFAAWQEYQDNYVQDARERFAEGCFADPSDFDPFFDFLLDFPFPPTKSARERLNRRLFGDDRRARSPISLNVDYFRARMEGGPTLDGPGDRVTVTWFLYEKVPGANRICLYTGEGVRRQMYRTRRSVSFTWMLPVDDERFDEFGLPRHRLLFSGIPGVHLPHVMQEVADYLALRDIEQWIAQHPCAL